MIGTVQDTVQDSEENLDLWPLFFLSGPFHNDAAMSKYRRQYIYMGFAMLIHIYSHTFSENNWPNIYKNGYRNDDFRNTLLTYHNMQNIKLNKNQLDAHLF
jgi:hypothetical protein